MRQICFALIGFLCGMLSYESWQWWKHERRIKKMADEIDEDLRKLEEHDDIGE